MEAEIATNPKIDALLMPDYNCNLKWLNSSAIPGERAFSSHVKSDRKVWSPLFRSPARSACVCVRRGSEKYYE